MRFRQVGRLLAVSAVALVAAVGTAAPAEAATGSALTKQFRDFGNNNTSTTDWTAGDDTLSIKLAAPDNRVLWLMGDSYMGYIRPGDRARTPAEWYVGNHVMIQNAPGATPAQRSVFPNGTGNPAFAKPADCPNYWPHAGIQTGTATVQILLRCTDVAGNIKRIDLWQLQEVSSQWRTTMLTSNLAKAAPTGSACGGKIVYGDAMFSRTTWVAAWGTYVTETFVYGRESCPGVLSSYLHVARVTVFGEIPDLRGDWWYQRPDGTEVSAPSAATRLNRVYGSAAPTVFDEAGAEYSVVRLSDTSYRLITSQVAFGPVRRFTSTTPRGPWRAASNAAATVFSPPEMYANGKAIYNGTAELAGCQLWSYGAKEHPEFNDPGRVVISYNVGVTKRDGKTCDIHKAQNASADNYRPVFIDIAG